MRSLKIAYAISSRRKLMPIFSAISMNFSLGFLRVITSATRKSACPPSRAGMGRTFIKASMSDINAVSSQKRCQSHVVGKSEPMAPNEPIDLAPSFVKRYFKSSM